ncbi:MAG: hypothetical protein NTW20_17365 [Rhodobacterales bacterium]|nr:hypothetical protein [Rhodobacterales bacterium]
MTERNVLLEQITSLVRAEFDGGFPLMTPVPSTDVMKLIEYVNSVDAAERDALVAEIAAGTRRLLQGETVDVIGTGGAYDRFQNLKMSGGSLSVGPRYTDVRTLADARYPTAPGTPARPRDDLLPDRSTVIPATAKSLRPRVKEVMTSIGFSAHKAPAGGTRFLSPAGTLVDFDFGARLAQLRFGVAINAAAHVNAPLIGGARFLSPGVFYGFYGDNWDYVTEENADRSVAHLPVLIAAAEDMLRLVD